MRLAKSFILFFFLYISSSYGQTISPSVPKTLDKNGKYLFYQHSAVVTEFGNNAINQSFPEWGPYEYLNILDSFRSRGFNVISEIRQKGLDDYLYVNKIVKQIDSLLKAGITTKNIIVVGASSGWNITLYVASKLKNKEMNYVIMGGCWPESYKDYTDIELYGNFLSIIESSDPHGTCKQIFENQENIKTYKEIILKTGLSHGFIYKGYKEWIDPVVHWIEIIK